MEYLILDEDVQPPGDADPGMALDGIDVRWPACEEAVLALFPDMCLQHLKQLATQFGMDHEKVIGHVIDQQDLGKPYPKWEKTAKRKRQDDAPEEVEGAAKKIKFDSDQARLMGKDAAFIRAYAKAAKSLLAARFPELYVHTIESTLKDNSGLIYPSFFALEDMLDNRRRGIGLPCKVKARPKTNPPDDMFSKSTREAEIMADTEYKAAKTESEHKKAKARAEQQKKEEELQNLNRAKAEGKMADCECCYEEYPLNRMIHCDGNIFHWFCYKCAKNMADTQIGLSKYELTCMSMDVCNSGFSLDQRSLFLDATTTVALDRLEQEAVLRMAGLEGLAKCPFCPYAAEYPPVEENKEFRCENPTCGIVSCRLCDLQTHIPKSCKEAKAEEGHSARHRIEEAMSTALIRKCNKCKTPFIKENGCNKMTCSAPGCRNVQCYVCSKSCDYSHFDDASRGGKKGQCPLFDSVEARHEEEVKAAELKERQRVAEENPEVDGEFFAFNFSDNVKADDERRKAKNPGPAGWRPNAHVVGARAPNNEPGVQQPLQQQNQPAQNIEPRQVFHDFPLYQLQFRGQQEHAPIAQEQPPYAGADMPPAHYPGAFPNPFPHRQRYVPRDVFPEQAAPPAQPRGEVMARLVQTAHQVQAEAPIADARARLRLLELTAQQRQVQAEAQRMAAEGQRASQAAQLAWPERRRAQEHLHQLQAGLQANAAALQANTAALRAQEHLHQLQAGLQANAAALQANTAALRAGPEVGLFALGAPQGIAPGYPQLIQPQPPLGAQPHPLPFRGVPSVSHPPPPVIDLTGDNSSPPYQAVAQRGSG